MNRKLITLAVAAALAAPTAAMAEAVLYGKLNVSIDYVDVDANAYWASVFPGTGGVPRSGGAPNWTQALNGLSGNANRDFAPRIGSNGQPILYVPTTGAITTDPAIGVPAPDSTRPYWDLPGAQSLIYGTSDNFFTNGQAIPAISNDVVNFTGIVGHQTSAPVTYAAGSTVQFRSYDVSSKQFRSETATVQPNGSLVVKRNNVDVAVTPAGVYPANSVFGIAYNNALVELQAQGFTAAQAQAAAYNLGLNAAWQAASDEQRNVAAQQMRTATGGQSFKGWGLNMNGRASRIGVKGSEKLVGDLKAIYQVEINVDIGQDARDDNNLLNGNRGNGFSFRNSFVGLAGNWGSVLVGRHDTPLKMSTGKLDLFADTLADMNYTVGFQDLRADNVVAYISPKFSGFTFSAAIVPAGGATGGSGYNADSDSLAGAYSLAGVYNNGPFYVSVAYENMGSEMFMASNPFAGLAIGQSAGDIASRAMFGSGLDDDTKLRVGLGLLDWNGFTLAGIYEQHSNVNGAPKDADMDLWQIQAAYAFGNSQVKAMYGQAEVDACVAPFTFTCTTGIPDLQNKDKSTWAIGFDHNFSKRTKVYALYTAMDDDSPEADWSGFSLGMMHSF